MRRTIIASLLLLLLAAHGAAADEPLLTIDPGGHLGKIMDVMFTSDGRRL